jgi:hypothetical protein
VAKRYQTFIRHSAGFVLCDCVSDFAFESSLEFTDHPIDDASSISDHAVRKPETMTLTLVATQTPMRPIAGFSVGAQPLQVKSVGYGKQKTELKVRGKAGISPNVSSLIDSGVRAVKELGAASSIEGLKVLPAAVKGMSISVLRADAGSDRVNAFFEELLRLKNAVERLTISFKGRDYADLVLTSVSKTDKPGQLGKSSFQVSLKKVRTVATKQVTLPAVPKAKAKKERGVQYGPPPPPEMVEEERRKAIAAQIFDMARGS